MQRKALLLYLRELRDLEFANWKLEKMYNSELKNYNREYNELTRIETMDEPPEFKAWTGVNILGFGFCLIMSLMGLIAMIGLVIEKPSAGFLFLFLFMFLCFLSLQVLPI